MAGKDTVDQEALAADWGLALEAETAGADGTVAMSPASGEGDGNDEMAAQWAAMIEDGNQFVHAAKGGAERILNQEEIDSLLGFSVAASRSMRIRAFGRSSTRRWSPTSVCRCSRSCSTGWSG